MSAKDYSALAAFYYGVQPEQIDETTLALCNAVRESVLIEAAGICRAIGSDRCADALKEASWMST